MTNTPKTSHSLIANLNAQERVEGGYRLSELLPSRTNDGALSWHMKLSDRSGTIDAFWPHPLLPNLDLGGEKPNDILIDVGFRTRQYGSRLVADAYEINGTIESPEPRLALERLPRHLANGALYLDQLAMLVNGLQEERLRDAIDVLLVSDDLTFNWISQHNDLLAHSVKSAEYAKSLIGLDPQGQEVLIVACLFRHLGELVLYSQWIDDWGGAPPVPAQALTLELCAPALWQLQASWPAGANALRALWGYGLRAIQNSQLQTLAVAMDLSCRVPRTNHIKGETFFQPRSTWEGNDDSLSCL